MVRKYNMDSKVSVIVPTYKRKVSLDRAINSLMEQTYPNVEIIVIDDNGESSDYDREVKEIISKYSQCNKELIHIKNERNLGSSKTRNRGIFKATGKYITFLDDDDIYLPEKIAKQVRFMEDNKLQMCFTDLVLKNKEGKIVDIRKRNYLTSYDRETLLKCHLMYHITGTDTFMYTREFLHAIGGFDSIDIGDEFYLMVKTINSGEKIGYLPSNDTIAYVHGFQEGLSTGDNKVLGENMLYEFKKNYFNKLSKAEIKYIQFRHYAVLAYVSLKGKKIGSSIKNILAALWASPTEVFKIGISLMKKKSI
ncbi:hypothetical protein AZF06_00040 [Priestia endophytica]|nr:hypothetical protein AZF06_00040 [Priestia endophytica]